MSNQTVITYVSDMSKEEYTPGETGETISFSLDGISYEIDVTTKEGAALRDAMAPFIAEARRTRGKATDRKASAPAKSSDVKDDRVWLRENGYTVKDRGRLTAAQWEAYRNGTTAPETVSAPVLEDSPDGEAWEYPDTTTDAEAPAEAPQLSLVPDDDETESIVAWFTATGKTLTVKKDGQPDSKARAKYRRHHGIGA